MVEIKLIDSFKDYGKCVSISNGVIEAYVTVDLGPRIIKFGFIGGQNLMQSNRREFGEKTDKTFTDYFGENKAWENFGGHRIWLSPESYPETYYPDDSAVLYTITENGAIFTPKPETENGIAKTLEIKMDKDDTNMQVIMSAKNISDKPKEFSLWGLTVSEKNGTIIVPMNTNDTGLLHNRSISVWPYTDMSDERIYFGKRYVTVKQDPDAKTALKLGFDLNCGCAYYVLGDDVFCKSYATNHPNGRYPDAGCSFETYSCSVFTEVESLGELKTVAPGETSTLIERWSICKRTVDVDFRDDDSIDNLLKSI